MNVNYNTIEMNEKKTEIDLEFIYIEKLRYRDFVKKDWNVLEIVFNLYSVNKSSKIIFYGISVKYCISSILIIFICILYRWNQYWPLL